MKKQLLSYWISSEYIAYCFSCRCFWIVKTVLLNFLYATLHTLKIICVNLYYPSSPYFNKSTKLLLKSAGSMMLLFACLAKMQSFTSCLNYLLSERNDLIGESMIIWLESTPGIDNELVLYWLQFISFWGSLNICINNLSIIYVQVQVWAAVLLT